jgi:hypothetical protein
MHTQTTLKILGAILVALTLSACGGAGKDSAVKILTEGKSSAAGAGGSSSSVTNTNTIGADILQSIEFKDASPSVINLKGTGGAESSLVRFRVLAQTGTPIKGITVDFVLNTVVGGLKLSQESSKSDDEGYISTSVVSGTVSTSVRVTATTRENKSITTQSNQLAVATGLPDQKSMSIAAEKFAPPGWGRLGVTSAISVRLADAYNNPAADGTAITFTTEGGSIESSCTTTGGGCSVKWISQDPKPERNGSNTDTYLDVLCLELDPADNIMMSYRSLTGAALHECRAKRAGRVTIRATAIGNESFKDTNGNGIFDPAVDLFKTSSDAKCKLNVPQSSFESSEQACDDLPEAYLDKNESSTRSDDEDFVNFVSDKTHDADPNNNYSSNNGVYNGAFCQAGDEAQGLCSRSSVTIRKDLVIAMSCENPILFRLRMDQYALADCNGNSLPTGTKITIGISPETTLTNTTDWTTISAAASVTIKLKMPITESSSVETSVTTY